MHTFLVHSNESACRKSGPLGLEQVTNKTQEQLCETRHSETVVHQFHHGWRIHISDQP